MIERYANLAGLALAALTESAVTSGAVSNAKPDDPMCGPDSVLVRSALNALDHTRRASIYIDVQHDLGPEVERFFVTLRKPIHVGELHVLMLALRNRVFDILQGEFFFHLDPRDVPLYGKKELFGASVVAKFPESIEDIENAGNCLALRQPTACVFHLMRVMERAVQRLGKILGVKLNPKSETWFMICNHASKAVTNRPSQTKAQMKKNAALGAAVAHLQTVRLAWRNEVMHPKQTYTLGEAQEVLNATRAFMTDLAGLL